MTDAAEDQEKPAVKLLTQAEKRAQNRARLEGAIASLTKRVDLLEIQNTALNRVIDLHEKRIASAEKALEFVDRHKATKLLGEMRTRIQELGVMVQAHIMRNSVATEVTRYNKTLWTELVRCLDADDEWWLDGGHCDLEAWAARISRKAEELKS